MEKASVEMDLDEWEFIPDDGFLDFHHHEHGGSKLVCNKMDLDPKDVFDMNYFICPSPTSHHIVEKRENSGVSMGINQLIPVPSRLESTRVKNSDQELVKEIIKVPIVESSVAEKNKILHFRPVGEDQEIVSQVFFKKMKENEFVDMKMDSPKSDGGRGIKPQAEAGLIQFEEDDKGEAMQHKTSSEVEIEQEMMLKNYLDSNIKEEGSGGGISFWGWKPTGIGALGSIGVAAAAAICIFIFGSGRTHENIQHNQKLQFQIYSDDKRIKQVVHHATKLNQAISAVRGVPVTRAQITFGGYYDGH